jgi:branched-chain amino acid transport system ATP-binding protein
MTEPLLAVHDLEVKYAAVKALFGISVEVPPGGVLAVLGPNGAGKSTLARAVSGLVPSSAGRITFDGHDITGWAPHLIRRAGLVHIPEGRGIFPGLTVLENVRMAVRRVVDRRERQPAIDKAFDLFPALAQRRQQRAGSLSGGEQQMLALARALAVTPRLLIADEMSLGLAPRIVEFVFENIARAREELGVSIVLIEQFVHQALRLADQCVILRQGNVVWSGSAEGAKEEVLDRYLGETAEAIA